MSEILSIIHQDQRSLLKSTSEIGEIGERLAADFLVENGYRLVIANFKVPVGRNTKGVQVTGEIDLIALDSGTLCFIEVKTRRSDEFTPVITNVDRRKQRQIIRTARVYRRIFRVKQTPYRFDVVTVLLQKDREPVTEIVKAFWNEDKFRKKAWRGDIW